MLLLEFLEATKIFRIDCSTDQYTETMVMREEKSKIMINIFEAKNLKLIVIVNSAVRIRLPIKTTNLCVSEFPFYSIIRHFFILVTTHKST